MELPDKLNVPGTNRLLALLPQQEHDRLGRTMERVDLKLKDVLFESGKPISHVFFPLRGVVSLIVTMENGQIAEVATTGNEGMIGLPLLLGAESITATAFAQVPGNALRMPAHVFVTEIKQSGVFPDVLRRYCQCFMTQVLHSTACNRLHAVEQRLCRWILMCHDRVGGDALPLTQEFLAEMLGVRRASINFAASMLQNAGCIRYSRGVITVLNRAGLESASCECYAVVRREFERLLC
ncbi:MAG TPA: Crp/Fnr family transcriptional regulator [Burkholderiales bacterium]